MIQSYLVASAIVISILPPSSLAFTANPLSSARRSYELNLSAVPDGRSSFGSSRNEFVSGVLGLMTASVIGSSKPASAKEFSIEKCSATSKNPCVSTSNVRNLNLYLPPWTYTTSAEDVMSRLKGAVIADPTCSIVRQDGDQHLVFESKRLSLGSQTTDTLEFVINDTDKVVIFKSLADSEGSDFGVNRNRLEEIRKRAGIFGIMGEYMNSADSFTPSQKGNGPLGQLKAFYGLQSGEGFEDVLLDR
jgi:uncharacterized protein (DUF1499 family)